VEGLDKELDLVSSVSSSNKSCLTWPESRAPYEEVSGQKKSKANVVRSVGSLRAIKLVEPSESTLDRKLQAAMWLTCQNLETDPRIPPRGPPFEFVLGGAMATSHRRRIPFNKVRSIEVARGSAQLESNRKRAEGEVQG
jgi:hypothetical protein